MDVHGAVGDHRDVRPPRRRARPTRCWRASASTRSCCPPGRTGWPAIWPQRRAREGRRANEAPRHRRRRLHRLELRAPPARRPIPRTRSSCSTSSPTPAGAENLEGLPTAASSSSRATSATARRSAPHGRRAATRSSTSPPSPTSTARSRTPGEFITTDVFGTFVLLEAARDAGIRHLQISTDEVYGSIDEGSFTETSPLDPSSPYSASKAGGDLIVSAFSHTYGADALIVRASNNYGPRQHPGEADPAGRAERAARRPDPGLRRRQPGPQLALRRGLLQRRSTRCSRRARPARSTTSAAPTSCRTSRSSGRSSS